MIVDLRAVVKRWEEKPPAVEQVRPTHCRWCGAVSQPVGESLNLVGHGKRQRQLRGPLEPQGEPCLVLVWVRRFLCLLCEQSMTVWPPAVVPRRYYSGSAILLALALWSVVGLSARVVRQRVSPWKQQEPGWPSLGRWVGAVKAGRLFAGRVQSGWRDLTIQKAAARIVLVIAGGPLDEDPWARAHRAFYAGAVSA